MEEVYDQFPINILEMGGRIERTPIGFMIHAVCVWESGRCILRSKKNAVIIGKIVNEEMHIELRCVDLDEYIDNNLIFSEISLNGDRVLWSNGFFEGGYSSRDNVPAYLSLFYQLGDLRKVQFSNQRYLIEFYGTTIGYDIYEKFMNIIKNKG